MSRHKKPRFQVLSQATKDVADRENRYGDPNVNHARIARLTAAYLACKPDPGVIEISKMDSIVFQILTNIARLIETPNNKGAWENIAGYAAIGHEVTEK